MEQPQNIARKDDKVNPLESCDRGAIFDGQTGPIHTIADDIVVGRKGRRRGERRRNGADTEKIRSRYGEDTEQIRGRSKAPRGVKDMAAMRGNSKVMI